MYISPTIYGTQSAQALAFLPTHTHTHTLIIMNSLPVPAKGPGLRVWDPQTHTHRFDRISPTAL